MRELAFAGSLPETVAALLRSTTVYLYEDSVLVKEPGAAERTQWHQDLGYFHVDGTQTCTTRAPCTPRARTGPGIGDDAHPQVWPPTFNARA